MNWCDQFVPDAEACIALFTMGMPQKNTVFVWVDYGVLNHEGRPNYVLRRAVELSPAEKPLGVFAAYTTEEFQTVLPHNFVPLQARPGIWMIVDLYGTVLHDDKQNNMEARQIILSRVKGSDANRSAQAFAQAAIYLIQSGSLKLN